MRVAIQGELGSNSHLAARAMVGEDAEVVACALSADVFAALAEGGADAAVLPIENSLHGSVSEHYDLLLAHDARIDAEQSLRIVHNVIAAPGVRMEDVRRVLSHPVALSQCRGWLRERRGTIEAVAFYDTAGAVKHVVAGGLRDAAGIAPALAAEVYAGEVIAAGIEDNRENYTRFQLLRPGVSARDEEAGANKASVAFALEHKPGSLVRALAALADAGADLTRIESRPVPGKPWEYVFFVDFRFSGELHGVLAALGACCGMVKELGRYRE